MSRPDNQPPPPDLTTLRVATPDELGETLAYPLQFSLGKRVRDADDFMARAGAARLVEHLERSGYVEMKTPRREAHTAGEGRLRLRPR